MRPPKSISPTYCSISSFFISFSVLSSLFLIFFLLSFSHNNKIQQHGISLSTTDLIRVYVADLPGSLNYGLLEQYWSLPHDSRVSYDPDHGSESSTRTTGKSDFPPYPENPLIKQYSAEYWILGDLMSPQNQRSGSYAKRVFDASEADVVLVPFFATLSAEMQLAIDRSLFRKKVMENEDYKRQKEAVDFVMSTEAWNRSGGRDHVFVLTDPVAMWHVKDKIAPSILLVVDFGGWFRLDGKSSDGNNTSDRIQHTQVSLLKDVIVPYTHLLPRLHLAENKHRHTLLYFKGARHRARGGVIREQLWDLLVHEPGIIMEEGYPNVTGKEQSIRGMRTSEFCLHPAGDTPTSCRIFDAIQSLCIPVIISDHIELPFEGLINYSEFSVFVSVENALQPNWLVQHLRSYSREQREKFRGHMARVQPAFVYDNGYPGGVGPVAPDGAVNHIWRKVHQKLPFIREAIVREKRKPPGTSIPLRCHCT